MILGVHEIDLSSGRLRGREDELHELDPGKVGISSRIGSSVRQFLEQSSIWNSRDTHFEFQVFGLDALIVLASEIALGKGGDCDQAEVK